MVSKKQIESILKRYSSAFKALEEFEKTKNVIVKKRLNFTIDRVLAKEFRDYCRDNNINMSQKIEESIRTIMKSPKP